MQKYFKIFQIFFSFYHKKIKKNFFLDKPEREGGGVKERPERRQHRMNEVAGMDSNWVGGFAPKPTPPRFALEAGTDETQLERAAFSLDFSTNFQNTLQKRLQTKIVELAKHYNEESIEAVTNFFADILSFATLWFLLVRLEIQINITKSFLLEVFFGLDDSKKSLLILFLTDLLVGYHSPNIWELFFQTLFDHYGLPESQTTIFLLVATLPVLLDVLFKYLIFRHLNRASPATVATYHAMIE
jgi:hypothetical protein